MLRNPANWKGLLAMPALALILGTTAWAGPPAAPAIPAPSAPAARVIPDYGGRTAALGSALDASSGVGTGVNPMAQAGKAFEALVIVLVVVAGGLFLLKRSGLLKGDGTATVAGPASWASLLSKRPVHSSPVSDGGGATEMLTLLGSQTLPHSPGAGLHLVSVGGRVLLLGATGQSVTLLTEVAEFALPADQPPAETPEEVAAFADYLARVGVAAPVGTGAESTRASLSAATDRLQSLLSRGQK